MNIKYYKNKNGDKKLINLRKVMCGIIALISVIVVFSTIQTSTIGSKLQYLEEKERTIERETRMLEEELTSIDSLSKMSEDAEKFKFTKPQKIVYFKDTVEVGLNLR